MVSVGVGDAGKKTHCVNLAKYPPDHDFFHTHESFELLRDRQKRLIELGDAYLALPGAVGTTHEITEVMSNKSLGGIPKDRPLICVGKEWHAQRQQFRDMVRYGVIAYDPFTLVDFVPTVEKAIALLKQRL